MMHYRFKGKHLSSILEHALAWRKFPRAKRWRTETPAGRKWNCRLGDFTHYMQGRKESVHKQTNKKERMKRN